VARPDVSHRRKIQAIGDHTFTPGTRDPRKVVMSESQLREYGENLELNMAMSLPGVSFRVNVFRQRGSAVW
jgi:Tfp pilus assembly ATPase PilU